MKSIINKNHFNIKGKDLRIYDIILDWEMYPSSGGLFSICLLSKENYLLKYPYSWCDLINKDTIEGVKNKCSGVIIEKEKTYIKIGQYNE